MVENKFKFEHMKLATKVRYGTRILLDLAMHQSMELVQMSDISARQNISLKYLEQLIRPFKAAGFVSSKRGPKGGHSLAKKPEQISLAEIIRLFQGEHFFEEMPVDGGTCSDYQDYLIRSAWNKGTNAFYAKLESITLADLSIGTTKELWKGSDIIVI